MNTPIKKLHPDIEEVAEEFEVERAGRASSLKSEELHQSLEELRAGKSPKYFSADPEFQAAVRLHVFTSDSEIDDGYKNGLKKQLLNQFATEKVGVEKKAPFWKQQWFAPSIFASGFAGVAILVIILGNQLSFFNSNAQQKSLAVSGTDTSVTPSSGNTETEVAQQEDTAQTAIPGNTLVAPSLNTDIEISDPVPDTTSDSLELASLEDTVGEIEDIANTLDSTLRTVEGADTSLEEVHTEIAEVQQGLQLLSTSLNEQ